MRPLSIRARLTAGYLAVLTAATLCLAGGVWWLFRESVIRAADASLAGRVEGTKRFIETTQRELPPEEVSGAFPGAEVKLLASLDSSSEPRSAVKRGAGFEHENVYAVAFGHSA